MTTGTADLVALVRAPRVGAAEAGGSRRTATSGEGVLVVLPTYNEAPNVERVLVAILAALPRADVLVVDDASPDGTAELARRAHVRPGAVHVLERPGKLGLGTAYLDGFRWGLAHDYQVLCEIDADGSHNPADLSRLVAPVVRGEADLVVGSRYIHGGATPDWPFFRRAISRGGNVYANLLLRLGVRDATAGFRAYAASLLRQLDLAAVRADSYGFQVEMTWLARRADALIREVPIHFVDRQEGVSKMSLHTVTEAFVVVAGLWAKGRRSRLRQTLQVAAIAPSHGDVRPLSSWRGNVNGSASNVAEPQAQTQRGRQ